MTKGPSLFVGVAFAIGVGVAGQAQTISLLRDDLRARGWARGQIHSKAYWSDGKRGL